MSKSQCFKLKRDLRCQFAGAVVGFLWISKESAAQDLRECPPEAEIHSDVLREGSDASDLSGAKTRPW